MRQHHLYGGPFGYPAAVKWFWFHVDDLGDRVHVLKKRSQ